MEKPRLSFWQIWNMSFGFLGIQFGWNLQLGNMSAIYEYLGAEPDAIPILWLAAPMTGLLVQPIVGYYSDRTWNKLGRRRPYFLTGAILASIALILMPHSSALWMAAGLLWVLDASINISMEPFRAFVADKLPPEQHTKGYTMQSFFIGIGAVLASILPFIFLNYFGMEATSEHGVPKYLKIAFALGGIAFISAVSYTVFTTPEYPPEDMDAFLEMKKEGGSIGDAFKEIFSTVFSLPKIIKQLAFVQFFSWLGLFLMWFYFTTAVVVNVFGAPDPSSPLYADGVAWGNLCFGFYSVITFIFALFMPGLASKLGKKHLHAICLTIGGIALLSLFMVSNKYMLFVVMAGVGIAWTSILAMPYAMMASQLDQKKLGLYMGIFNFFIVIPEIMATLFFGWVMSHFLNNNRLSAVILAGAMLIIAALFTLRVNLPSDSDE